MARHLGAESRRVSRRSPALLDQDRPDAEERTREFISDVFAGKKATPTLQRRAGTLWMLSALFEEYFADDGVVALPLHEATVYTYINDLQRSRAPPTRASYLLEAWNFCVHVLGLEDKTVVPTSRGATARPSANHRPRGL